MSRVEQRRTISHVRCDGCGEAASFEGADPSEVGWLAVPHPDWHVEQPLDFHSVACAKEHIGRYLDEYADRLQLHGREWAQS